MHAFAHSGRGEKSLGAPGNRTCVSGVPVRRSTTWATSPSFEERSNGTHRGSGYNWMLEFKARLHEISEPLNTVHSLQMIWTLSGVITVCPRREAGDVWCLPPVWNLRAVIWFHFAISSLVLLPSPVTLSVLPFSACWPFLLNYFQKILQNFSLRDRLFCMAPV